MKKIALIKQRGITLIALVVTIITILTLAGICVSMITENNGILRRAKEAFTVYQNAVTKEKLAMGDLSEFELIQVSGAIKGREIKDLPTKEEYVGDFIKIGPEDLKKMGLSFIGQYYVNPATGEAYDIDGKKYNKITYHSIQELKQAVYASGEINTKRLLKMKYEQLDYLKNNQQHSNGAIATYTVSSKGVYTINPYFASIACQGMLEDIGSYGSVKRYIIWHLNHINMTEDSKGTKGTIYDYVYNGDTESCNNDYDSVDSYAAVFLSLLRKYVEKTGDKQLLIDNKAKIDLIAQAVNSVFSESLGLSESTATYPIYFLMDNAEVYKRI